MGDGEIVLGWGVHLLWLSTTSVRDLGKRFGEGELGEGVMRMRGCCYGAGIEDW